MSIEPLRVLAFDTSAHVTSLAICHGQVLIEQHEVADGKHAETLLPNVKAMLAQAGWTLSQIDVIAVGVGPGSFTGVRVGVATAKGLALALQKPVIPIVSLDALAYEALRVTDSLRIAACLDAFKGELFCAVYTRDGNDLRRERAPFHATPELVRESLAAISGDDLLALVGAGITRYPELLADAPGAWQIYDGIVAPRASVLAELAAARFAAGDVPELASVVPMYLRDSDAQLPKVPLRV
jgi:tRNA threonylcarbamoyladenosine biosynthesis protein TsaB